ncbi:Uncharacterized conserved protein [Janthinobacterium sp. Marseille]|nr:ABC-type transport auxiliary lipoprotein family protein [Janthinobacterium sp. Marseille]ABR88488.1 Uncharacterized conserved protein [Janthinobacterium sp. Marseille]
MKQLLNSAKTTGVLRSRLLTGVCVLGTVVLLAACANTSNARYYTLTGPTASALTPPASATPLFIELAPVAVPERLARPQMVLSKPAGQSAELELLEQYRWTSSFENEMRDALSAGITNRLGAVDVSKSGRSQGQAVWRIAVQLRQFDAIENTRVDAAFSWTARRSDTGSNAVCQWAGSEAVGSGMDALAQGAQRITDRAAQMIAQHLATLATNPAAPCPR